MPNKKPTNPTWFADALGWATVMGGLLFSQLSLGGTTFNVFDRNNKGDIVKQDVELGDLTSDTQFVGKNFRVVLGTSNDPIRFDGDPRLVQRAATAYYHLTRAREYYSKIPWLEQPFLNQQLTIRIEMDREFSPFLHFKGERFSMYNLSLTVGPSNDWVQPGVEPWGPEIWFYQGKKENKPTELTMIGDQLDSRPVKGVLLAGFLTNDTLSAISDYVALGKMDALFLKYHGISIALSIGLSEGVPWLLSLAAHALSPDYYIDSIRVPEIIYHEYGHIALGGYYGYIKPTPLNEGFPNYFASKMSGLTDLGENTHGAIRGTSGKHGKSSDKYDLKQEFSAASAHGSFVFSVLDDIDREMGPQGFEVICRSLKYLQSESSLRSDLPEAIHLALGEMGLGNSMAMKMKLTRVLRERGF